MDLRKSTKKPWNRKRKGKSNDRHGVLISNFAHGSLNMQTPGPHRHVPSAVNQAPKAMPQDECSKDCAASNAHMPTKMAPITPQSLADAHELLVQGEVVAIPTETVYGLAADARNASAVAKIYEAKGRPSFNPLIVHVAPHLDCVEKLADAGLVQAAALTQKAQEIADLWIRQFWPGPLTLVFPKGKAIADAVTAGQPTVAVRMPAHPGIQALLKLCDFPLAAPSANRSNRISPTNAVHVLGDLDTRIPLILDGGVAPVGVESTIVDLTTVMPRILRYGGVTPRQLSESGITLQLPEMVEPASNNAVEMQMVRAPGMLQEHYAPITPLTLADRKLPLPTDVCPWQSPGDKPKHVAILLLQAPGKIPPAWSQALNGVQVELISLNDPADGSEAARQLYSSLHALDRSGAQWIFAEAPPLRADGLWPTIADRLGRASARYQSQVQSQFQSSPKVKGENHA